MRLDKHALMNWLSGVQDSITLRMWQGLILLGILIVASVVYLCFAAFWFMGLVVAIPAFFLIASALGAVFVLQQQHQGREG